LIAFVGNLGAKLSFLNKNFKPSLASVTGDWEEATAPPAPPVANAYSLAS